MKQASNDAQLLKGGVTLTSPEVQAQVSTAMAQASAVPVRPFSSSDVGTEVEVAPPLLPPPSVVELALGPRPPSGRQREGGEAADNSIHGRDGLREAAPQ